MNSINNEAPDAFAHSSTYLAIRGFVRQKMPFLIAPWTACKRLIWLIRFPTAESRFKQIYKTNYWANEESLSGGGSTLNATRKVKESLENFILDHGIVSILDVPCGDFNWMKHVDLKIPYVGGDIVNDLVIQNQKAFENDQRKFQVIDLTSSRLPQCDLVFTRDCLNHLSISDIQLALGNILACGARYLAVTQYPNETVNRDQKSGFTYRPLNFCLPPFNWPKPLAIYDEESHLGQYLAFWRILDIPKRHN